LKCNATKSIYSIKQEFYGEVWYQKPKATKPIYSIIYRQYQTRAIVTDYDTYMNVIYT